MILDNFDLSFFTTIPGMLITGGVLLLLIALIIFIATGSKKGKKNKKEESVEPAVNEAPTVESGVATLDATPSVTPVESTNNIGTNPTVVAGEPVPATPEVQSEPAPVVESTPTQTVEPNPMVNGAQPIVETPETVGISTEPINNPVGITATNENSVPTVEPAISNEMPQVNQTVASVEPVQIVAEEPTVGTPNIPANNDAPTTVADSPAITIVNEEPNEQTAPTVEEEPKPIYGGVSPVIPKIEVAGEQHRPIYGGANPLENTQSIPITNRHVEPESPAIPTITPTVETPKEPDLGTISTPKVETNQVEPVIPTVAVETPKVEPAKEPTVSNGEPKKEEVESLL